MIAVLILDRSCAADPHPAIGACRANELGQVTVMFQTTNNIRTLHLLLLMTGQEKHIYLFSLCSTSRSSAVVSECHITEQVRYGT